MVEPRAITLVTADTARTPNEGYTAGSQSMQDSGTAILHAAAQVRAHPGRHRRRSGSSVPPRTAHRAAAATMRAQGRPQHDLRRARHGRDAARAARSRSRRCAIRSTRGVMGKSMPRVDIPAKVTGGAIYVQDLRLPGMVHARVVRPPSYGARLRRVDTARSREDARRAEGRAQRQLPRGRRRARVPGGQRDARARDGREVGRAARRCRRPATLYAHFQRLPTQDYVDRRRHRGRRARRRRARARPTAGRTRCTRRSARPARSGSSQDGTLTVWSHTQGVYPLRDAIAEMLRLPPERVRCIHMEGSGCYGHNGADDAGADAALHRAAFPGRPVRVQWMREDEHAWEPYGSVMISTARARLDGAATSPTGSTKCGATRTRRVPAPAGQSRAGVAPRERRSRRRRPSRCRCPPAAATATRSRSTRFRNARVVHHFVPAMPLRVSALRALGAYTTCSRSRASWTSSRARRRPIRSSSGCGTSRTRARAT